MPAEETPQNHENRTEALVKMDSTEELVTIGRVVKEASVQRKSIAAMRNELRVAIGSIRTMAAAMEHVYEDGEKHLANLSADFDVPPAAHVRALCERFIEARVGLSRNSDILERVGLDVSSLLRI